MCTHSFQALLQCHDALIAAALECLPAVADSTTIVVQSMPAAEAAKTCLLHLEAILVKEMQAFVTSMA